MNDIELFTDVELAAIAYAQEGTTAIEPTQEELSIEERQYYGRIARTALMRNIDVLSNELSRIDAAADDYLEIEFYRNQLTQCLSRIRA